VELDTATGHVRILDIAAFHDCGVMINPALVTGQLKGAIAMGVGTALWEELTYTSSGQLQSDRFKTYLMPRSTDLPPIRIGHMSTPSPFNPLGLKGAGESGVAGALAATINAVADALGRSAGNITTVPATAPRLMELLVPDELG
jgi:carbon-monoxide dehydrogenase large subunit